jgi:hypothetical protein
MNVLRIVVLVERKMEVTVEPAMIRSSHFLAVDVTQHINRLVFIFFASQYQPEQDYTLAFKNPH